MMSGRLAEREREREREREKRESYLMYLNGVVAVCSVSVPHDAVGWSAVCDYSIFCSYSRTFLSSRIEPVLSSIG